MVTLSEMKAHNKRIGHYFFAKGNAPVVAKKGNFLVTRGFGGGFVVYKYNPENGHIDYVDNPSGDYSTQPYESKGDAVRYAESLARGGK